MGLICVPVCAKTADELIQGFKKAAEYADIVELRFDYLDEKEMAVATKQVAALEFEKPLLVTFRPQEQGGAKKLSLSERVRFWESFLWQNRDNHFYTDFEYDLQLGHYIESKNRITSFHDFTGSLPDFDAVYETLLAAKGSKLKMAVAVDTITDSLPVWKMLERAKRSGKKITPIAMGEAGKWTRILGLAHGAYMTYAALDEGSETAPGQITAKEMVEVYRVKELDLNTQVYGIIGDPVSHSLSPQIHNAAFKKAGLNAVYIPLEVKDLDQFMRLMVLPSTRVVELNFHGFSVTVPHKQAIMQYLDEIDETANAIGAVNTVKIDEGKLYGYNTDADGFVKPLIDAYGDVKGAKVAVLGAGGAARACVYALKATGADVTIFARNAKKAKTLADDFGVAISKLPITNNQLLGFDILVNATPVGMKGLNENESLIDAKDLKSLKLVYDLVYSPEKTKLLADAESLSIKTLGGLEMLIYQATLQQKIWTGIEPVVEFPEKAVTKMA